MSTDPTATAQASTSREGAIQDPATPTASAAEATAYKAFATQKDFDDEAARIRGAAQRDAELRIYKELGIQPDGDPKLKSERLAALKAAFDEKLTAEQRTAAELDTLRTERNTLAAQVEEQSYVIAALTAQTGTDRAQVQKIVRMAKGLRDENTDIDAAIRQVLELTKSTEAPPTSAAAIPQGPALFQPEKAPATQPNPFTKEHYSLTEQGRLFREDPEKARRLAKEAGVKL